MNLNDNFNACSTCAFQSFDLAMLQPRTCAFAFVKILTIRPLLRRFMCCSYSVQQSYLHLHDCPESTLTSGETRATLLTNLVNRLCRPCSVVSCEQMSGYDCSLAHAQSPQQTDAITTTLVFTVFVDVSSNRPREDNVTTSVLRRLATGYPPG